MECRLTCVHHDCFVVQIAGRTLLFDYPDESLLPDCAAEAVERLATGADLWIFHSHSHEDHFTPAVTRFASLAARVHYALSWDVVDLHPEFDSMNNVTVLEPEEPCDVQGIAVTPFESTDMGVGMLLEVEGKRIWFGGDVAHWAWPEMDRTALDFSLRMYNDVLGFLAQNRPDLAMVNTDPRLENWAGAQLFLDRVQPVHMVPMHVFDDLDAVSRFIDAAELGSTRLLGRSQPCEQLTLVL